MNQLSAPIFISVALSWSPPHATRLRMVSWLVHRMVRLFSFQPKPVLICQPHRDGWPSWLEIVLDLLYYGSLMHTIGATE